MINQNMMKTLTTIVALGIITCATPAMADVPGNQKNSNTLTVEQTAELVKKANETRQRELDLSWLTSIDQDVACLLYTSPSPRD